MSKGTGFTFYSGRPVVASLPIEAFNYQTWRSNAVTVGGRAPGVTMILNAGVASVTPRTSPLDFFVHFSKYPAAVSLSQAAKASPLPSPTLSSDAIPAG